MDIKDFLNIMETAEKLKCNTRHSWTSTNRKESVAEHTWRLALMAYFVKDEFPDADINKVILMCLFHDLGEAFTGDIPAFIKSESDEIAEEKAIADFCDSLHQPYRAELTDLFREMFELKTTEAKLCKALDKMEVLIQHNEADLSTWLPLEYKENLIYGLNEVEFSPYMMKLKKAIKDVAIEKMNRA